MSTSMSMQKDYNDSGKSTTSSPDSCQSKPASSVNQPDSPICRVSKLAYRPHSPPTAPARERFFMGLIYWKAIPNQVGTTCSCKPRLQEIFWPKFTIGGARPSPKQHRPAYRLPQYGCAYSRNFQNLEIVQLGLYTTTLSTPPSFRAYTSGMLHSVGSMRSIEAASRRRTRWDRNDTASGHRQRITRGADSATLLGRRCIMWFPPYLHNGSQIALVTHKHTGNFFCIGYRGMLLLNRKIALSP